MFISSRSASISHGFAAGSIVSGWLVFALEMGTFAVSGCVEPPPDSGQPVPGQPEDLSARIAGPRTLRVDSDLVMRAEATGGTGPYTYEWSSDQGTISPTEAETVTFFPFGVSADTRVIVSLTVRDSAGDSVETSRDIFVQP